MKREFKPKVEKQVTHIDSEAEFIRRHQYCITIAEVQMTIRDTQKRNPEYVFKPDQMKAVCDHPEDGMCGYSISAENLRKVNERLSGRAASQAPEKAEKIETSLKRKRGRPRKVVPEGLDPLKPKYFCLQCSIYHHDDHISRDRYVTHMKFKRGRGRPRKA